MIKVVCSHLVAISRKNQYFLFSIPELEPIHTGQSSRTIPATQLSVRGPEDQSDIWNTLCCHPNGRIAMPTMTLDSDDFSLVVWPPAGQMEDTFVWHPAVWQFDMNPSRAIWVKHYDFSDAIDLYICTHFTRSDEDAGYMRLRRSKAPHPSRVLSVQIPLVGHNGYIKDLSWDEESGRISIFFVSLDKGLDTRQLMILYLE